MIGSSLQDQPRPGLVPLDLPSAIRRAQKRNRRSMHLTSPCIDPPWLNHLLFSTLATDLTIYVKDGNSSTVLGCHYVTW